MNAISLLSGIVVFALSFYGFGTMIGTSPISRRGVKRLVGVWASLDGLVATVVSSFIISVTLVWALGFFGVVTISGERGVSWGTYIVEGSRAANALIALSLSAAFVALVAGRLALTVPAVTRSVVRSVEESSWLVKFMKWCIERRRATIAGAMWILHKLGMLRRLLVW